MGKKRRLSTEEVIQVALEVKKSLEQCMNDLAEGDEAQAIENWNDPDVLYDLLGDRILDQLVPFGLSGRRLQTVKIKVAMEISDRSHPALAKACGRITQ